MIINDLKRKLFEFQKNKDTHRLGVLRYLLSKIQNKEIELRGSGEELTDEIVLKVIDKQIKQQKESFEIYKNAGRTDLADKESSEVAVLEEIRNELN